MREEMIGDQNRRWCDLTADMSGCRGILHVIEPGDTLYTKKHRLSAGDEP